MIKNILLIIFGIILSVFHITNIFHSQPIGIVWNSIGAFAWFGVAVKSFMDIKNV